MSGLAGFALAKRLIGGLSRCPNSSLWTCGTYPAKVTEGEYGCVALLNAKQCTGAGRPCNVPVKFWDPEQVGVFGGEQPAAA